MEMKQPKQSVTVLLMVSSIVLLLALQVLWLTNSYERAYIDMRKEINGLFRGVVMTLNDSMMVRHFERIPVDSFQRMGTRQRSAPLLDTLPGPDGNFRFKQGNAQIQIIMRTGSKDSLHTILRPFASRVRDKGFGDGGTFLFRMGPDSISLDSIRAGFRRALRAPYGNLPFIMKYDAFVRTPVPMSSTNATFLRRMDDTM